MNSICDNYNYNSHLLMFSGVWACVGRWPGELAGGPAGHLGQAEEGHCAAAGREGREGQERQRHLERGMAAFAGWWPGAQERHRGRGRLQRHERAQHGPLRASAD